MDKILVCGASGFLGSNLVNYFLSDSNNYVYGIDNFSSSNVSNLYFALKSDRFNLIEQNLTSDINLKVDYIFNLAGCGCMDRYFDNRYEFLFEQIEIAKNLINLTKLNGSKLVLFTQYLDYNSLNSPFFDWFDTLRFIENIAKLITNKVDIKFIRLDNVFGENLLKNDKRFIVETIINAKNGKDITINFDKKHYYSYSKDIISSLGKIKDSYFDDFYLDIMSKDLYLKSDIARFICKYLKSDSKINIINQDIYTPCYKPDLKHEKLLLTTPIYEALAKTIEFFKLAYFT